MIGHIDRGVDSVQEHEVLFDPVAKSKEFDVDMAGLCGGLLRIAHCCAAVVILVEEGSRLLWYDKVP